MQIKRILAVLALLLMPSIVAAWGPMVGSGVESGGGGWSCTDAGLLCESFDLETAGNYDNTATEVGTEGTINADATHY